MATFSKNASSSSDEEIDLRRGPWTYEEDTLLINYITHHGEGHWNLLAKRSGLRRTGKSCRLRWLNYLKPDVKRGNLSPQEQLLILNLHSKWGNRWSKIAQFLPGRTDNEIKNYWRTRVQKQARHLKIDPNSAAFKEIIDCFWIPRLVQKMQGSLPSSAIPTQHLISDRDGPLNHASCGVSVNISETAESLVKQHSSSAVHYTNSSVSSSEPLSLPQVPHISESSSASPGHAMATSCDYNAFLKGFSDVENISYDMETFSLASAFTVEDCRYPCNWIDCDLTESLWNMDEQWQLRQTQ